MPQPQHPPSWLPHVTEEITGWGRSPRREGTRYRPAKLSTLRQLGACSGLIARGSGRSYGDAALPARASGGVIDITALDRFLSFDTERGLLRAESGVTLQQLLSVTVPHGWFVPVVPGTAACTLGGMVAADVHGKNHAVAGSFQNVICSLTLLLPDGDEVSCSPIDDPELFAATCGGMGLTGIVLDVEIGLQRIESAWVRRQTQTFTGLDACLAALDDTAQEHAVAWVDGLVPHAQFGRSVLISGDFASADAYRSEVAGAHNIPPLHLAWETPRKLPALARWLLRPATMRLHNARHFRHAAKSATRSQLEPLQRFFFPLDRWRDWNRVYGKSGFAQYQFVVPRTDASEMIRKSVDTLQRAGHPPYLVVVKKLGAGHGMLSFPAPGITVALDVPQKPGVDPVFNQLDRDVVKHGGRVYLAKDARLSASMLREMYPELDRFLAVRDRVDPDRQLVSAMAERLRLGGEGAR